MQTAQYNGTWKIDPAHSTLGFSVRHAMVATVRGTFEEVAGEIVVADGQGQVNATVPVASVSTGQEKRDGHLRSADFFNVEANPTATFISTEIASADSENFVMKGDLTLCGVTKPVELKGNLVGVQVDHSGNTRAGFEATGAISRNDFGMVWNTALETGGVLVSDEVKLTLDISAIKAD